MRTVPSFVLAAGLMIAVAAPVFAQTTASPHGMMFPPGSIVTMRDELENFPVDTSLAGAGIIAPPTTFTGPPGFIWPDGNIRGQAANFTRILDISGAPVSGANGVTNASKVLRIFTHVAQAPHQFFYGMSYRFGGGEAGGPLLGIEPLAGMNARVSAEHWVSSIATLYTFELISSYNFFTVRRTIWGGGCIDIAPLGCQTVLDYFLVYAPDASFQTWAPARYCEDANGNAIPGCVPPTGFNIGDIARPPIQNWFRLIGETTADGQYRLLVDHLDGSGEVTIHQFAALESPLIDRIGWNASFEAQGEFMLIDNIEASGGLWQPPPPPPLTCPYLDDIEWLITGPLSTQNTTRWFAAFSSGATVINDGPHGQVISQTNNVSPDNHYRSELATELPFSSVTLSNDLIATVRVRTNGSTVRGFALFDDDNLVARVLLNYWPTDSFEFDERVYVQINPEYEPIDDPDAKDPLTNAPVIGVDIVDTNADWQNDGVYRTLELRLSANGVLRVSIEGQRIYAGPGAFSGTADGFAFESENNVFASESRLHIDDVTLTCDAPSCAADFNLDDIVDFTDLNTVLTNFGIVSIVPPQYFLGNANGDDSINFADLNAVLAAFGTNCR